VIYYWPSASTKFLFEESFLVIEFKKKSLICWWPEMRP
jgi:hypothetical protein